MNFGADLDQQDFAALYALDFNLSLLTVLEVERA
jgi:hypothetical protein